MITEVIREQIKTNKTMKKDNKEQKLSDSTDTSIAYSEC